MLHPSPTARLAHLVLTALLLSPVLPARAGEDKLELGKAVFTEQAVPACAVCHTLADAGSTGTVGPNLDELRPSAERVATAVRSGIGIMPSFEALSDTQVEAVAAYVSTVSGRN